MLKKLVRHGNSTAIVFDRAILELLDIKEGSIVKLRTDGTSLIITPAEQPSAISKMLANSRDLHEAQQKQAFSKNYLKDHPEKDALTAYSNSLEAVSEELRNLAEKQLEVFETSPHKRAFQEAVNLLKSKYNELTSDYEREFANLRDIFIPELKEGEEKNKELLARMSFMLNNQGELSNEEFAKVQKTNAFFKEFFTKYVPVMKKLSEAMLSEAYLQEVEDLREKYAIDSPEYVQEFLKIKYKFVPETEQMDREMENCAKV